MTTENLTGLSYQPAIWSALSVASRVEGVGIRFGPTIIDHKADWPETNPDPFGPRRVTRRSQLPPLAGLVLRPATELAACCAWRARRNSASTEASLVAPVICSRCQPLAVRL